MEHKKGPKIFWIQIIFDPKCFGTQKFFWTPKFLQTKNFLGTQNILDPAVFQTQNLVQNQIFFGPLFFFRVHNFFDPKFFWTHHFFLKTFTWELSVALLSPTYLDYSGFVLFPTAESMQLDPMFQKQHKDTYIPRLYVIIFWRVWGCSYITSSYFPDLSRPLPQCLEPGKLINYSRILFLLIFKPPDLISQI